jgi:hypothetical protein
MPDLPHENLLTYRRRSMADEEHVALLIFFWRLRRQVGRLLPVEDAVQIVGRLSVSMSPGFAPHVYRLETMQVRFPQWLRE